MPCKLQSAVAPFIQDMISWEKLDLMDCIVVSGEPLHQDLPPFLKSGNGKRITSKTDVVICSIDGLYQPDTLWGKVYHARLLEMNASIMASETHHPKPTVAPIEIKGCGGSMLAAKLQLSMAIAANIKRFEKLGVDAEAFVGLHVAAGGWYIILAESGGAEMVVKTTEFIHLGSTSTVEQTLLLISALRIILKHLSSTLVDVIAQIQNK